MQKLQLSIPEPCHESWQQMTPTEQGRFCNACAKEVIDFSSMTDIQVLNYFTNLTHEKICGRALPEQLDRIISRPEQPKKRLFWYWNYIAMFFMFFAKGSNAAAQSCTKPTTELAPVNNANLRGEMIVVDELKKNGSRVITGKVTDIGGNPVPFASVQIKGKNSGVSADVNGAYSLHVNSNSILIVSGAGYKNAEVSVGIQTLLNIVIEKDTNSRPEVKVSGTLGGISFRNSEDFYGPEDRLINVAVLAVKDESSGKAIEKASIVITKNSIPDSVLTDKKGVYKLKGIKKYEEYFIKVIAEGYEANEFTIAASDFEDRKKEWEILLRKEKKAISISTSKANTGKETTIRLRCENEFGVNAGAIYVIDGVIMTSGGDISPDEVEDYAILKGLDAVAIFGPEAAKGAVAITTRKTKEISMKELVINSDYGTNCTRRMAGGISFTNIYEGSLLGDTIATVKTMLTDSIKVYPNPVERNTGFSVLLKLKQAGNYNMQVTDASGKILLLQPFNAAAKNHTEKITADRRWAAGIYYLRVFDNKNKLITKASFIIQ